MRVAVAGTGSIGRRLIAQLLALLSKVRWVLLRSEGLFDAYARGLQVEVMHTLAAALEGQVAALLIATPSGLHADLVE